jgi:hypothetical protein
MNQEVSLEAETRGHANIRKDGSVMTIYLSTLTELLSIPQEYFPFSRLEDIIEDLTIHELLHYLTKVNEDSIIDSWRMLDCRLLNDRKNCDCPIDCFFRDSLRLRDVNGGVKT